MRMLICTPGASDPECGENVVYNNVHYYLMGSCCTDSIRMDNFLNTNYEEKIKEAREQCRRLYPAGEFQNGVNNDNMSLTPTVDPWAPLLRDRLISSGAPLWWN